MSQFNNEKHSADDSFSRRGRHQTDARRSKEDDFHVTNRSRKYDEDDDDDEDDIVAMMDRLNRKWMNIIWKFCFLNSSLLWLEMMMK